MYRFRLRNKFFGFGLPLMLGFCLLMPSQAQQYLGTLNGSVADLTGAKVVGAEVTATDTTTKFVTKAITNASGEYSIPFLTPDTYTIKVSVRVASAPRSASISPSQPSGNAQASKLRPQTRQPDPGGRRHH